MVCPELTQQILDLLVMATGKQIHACLMCEQISLRNIEEFLQEKPEHWYLNILQFNQEAVEGLY